MADRGRRRKMHFMSSRPQFSLRVLFFIIAVVGLAAATVAPVRDDNEVAKNAQAALTLTLCVAFPAMFTAASIQTEGYFKTFCIGNLFPALTALCVLSLGLAMGWCGILSPSGDFGTHIRGLASFTIRMWAAMPACGLLCVFFHWLLRISPTNKIADD